ncbi:MAG: hypothetical protein GY701_11965 [Sulfitobacter sp.]|nr:hypothetical protein [Sulfitobacter sp.]
MNMRSPTNRFSVWLAGFLLCASPLGATAIEDLFLTTTTGEAISSRQGETGNGLARFRINSKLFDTKGDRRVSVVWNGVERVFQRTSIETLINGTIIRWIGRLEGNDPGYRAILTKTEHGLIRGKIQMPDVSLRIAGRGEWVSAADLTQPAFTRQPYMDDGDTLPAARPDNTDRTQLRLPDATIDPVTNAVGDPDSTIDVMVLYTPALGSSPLPFGSDPETPRERIDDTIGNYANQALTDSVANMQFRVVHVEQVDYSDTTTNKLALCHITPGEQTDGDCSVDDDDDANDDGIAGVFSHVEDLRDFVGADLVLLLRQFNSPEQQGCGRAWILGDGNGSVNPVFDKPYGYAIAGDGLVMTGEFSYTFCADYTVAHELGHNMGDAHNIFNPNGVSSYSNGHGDTSFSTVMSTAFSGAEVGFFSNPNTSCPGPSPCGTATADNTRSMNEVRSSIAAFEDVSYLAVLSRTTATIRILKALSGHDHTPPLAGSSPYSDVVTGVTFGADWIVEAAGAARLIVGGCNASEDKYCPNEILLRATAARWLLRAVNGPAYTPPDAVSSPFSDIVLNTTFNDNWMLEAAIQGFMPACDNSNLFCPNQSVSATEWESMLDSALRN